MPTRTAAFALRRPAVGTARVSPSFLEAGLGEEGAEAAVERGVDRVGSGA